MSQEEWRRGGKGKRTAKIKWEDHVILLLDGYIIFDYYE
jgi:hypothetical protein